MEEALDFRPPKADSLKPGVSGLMRVKNDGEFIEACVESCLPALDELIIVYNDCSDDSEEVIRKCAAKYPEKIRVYEYTSQVLANNLTRAEYEEALALPTDSPRLLCNYYNYALAKARYSHALKIDADQIYFTDGLKHWCNIARGGKIERKRLDYSLGRFVFNYFRLVRKISISVGHRVPTSGLKWSKRLLKAYLHYAEVSFSEGSHTISLSGLNVYKAKNNKWYVQLGLRCKEMNVLPPFNGENDHLLFKISDETYYKPLVSEYYNLQRTASFSLIEEMAHPYTPINVGFCWYHLNACRSAYSEKVEKVFLQHPESYLELESFIDSSFGKVERRSDKSMFTLYQRILFSFLFKNMKSDLLYNKNFLTRQ